MATVYVCVAASSQPGVIARERSQGPRSPAAGAGCVLNAPHLPETDPDRFTRPVGVSVFRAALFPQKSGCTLLTKHLWLPGSAGSVAHAADGAGAHVRRFVPILHAAGTLRPVSLP